MRMLSHLGPQAATIADPSRSGPYSFWVRMERAEGYVERARELAARGLSVKPDDFHLLIQAAILEKDRSVPRSGWHTC